MKQCLFESKDNQFQLRVYQEGERRTLWFDDDNCQSDINMQEKHALLPTYLKVMIKALAFSSSAKRVLILGLGGGALVHYFQHYHPNMQLTVIEKETDVIECAKRFFEVNEKQGRLSLKKGDAFDSLTQHDDKYDLIFIDVFSLNQLPPHSFDAFYEACYRKLSINGSLAVNHVLDAPNFVAGALSSAYTCFKKKTLAFPLKGHLNLVILATRNQQFQQKIQRLLTRNECIITNDSKAYGLIAQPCL